MSRKLFHFILVVLTLAALSVPASAQLVGRTVTVANLPACNGPGHMALVTDATNATTLGSGGGSASVWVTCASGSWAIDEVAAVSDLTGYLETSGSKAAQILIEATGAGNDVTLDAADDVLLTPADDFVVTPTAGSSTINAVGAGEDVSLVAADDVFLTPAGDLTAVAAAGVTITATSGTLALASSAGAITATAVGATNDVSLVAADDVLLTPTDALTAAVGGAAAVTTTAGAITLTAGGTTQDISLISVDQVIVDGAGGSDELVIDDDEVLVGAEAAFRLAIASAPPVACASGTKASMYYDSDINKVCICNGTNYVLANDDSTTTGCS